MKKLIILSCLLLGINSYSQTVEEIKYREQLKASIQDEQYGADMKEIVKFSLSEDNLYEIYYNNNFIGKIGSVQNSRETCSLSDVDFEKWAQKNLDKTKFSSVKEAVEMFTNYRKYTKQNEQRHREINLKLEKYKEKYGLVIDQEFRTALASAEMNAYNKFFLNENNLTNIQ